MIEKCCVRMKKTISVIQSNYLPWMGYFSMVAASDVFVVYECVQYTKNDWRNRNLIHVGGGNPVWLTVPVRHERSDQLFRETRVANHNWAGKHFNALNHAFARTRNWHIKRDELKALYDEAGKMDLIHEINRLFLGWVFRELGVTAKIEYLESYPQLGSPTERLVAILKERGATRYLSGPAASSYLEDTCFERENISLEYVDYETLISEHFSGPRPFPAVSMIQVILEGAYEFKGH